MFAIRWGACRLARQVPSRGLEVLVSNALMSFTIPHSIALFTSSAGFRLPMSLIELKFVRSSGPGGQNVNKVSSAVEARIDLNKVTLPDAVKQRLLEQQKNRINSKLELVVDCQEDRSQHKNRERCLMKMQELFDLAFIEPKERIVQVTPPEKTKVKWVDEKRHRKEIKSLRQKINPDKYF